MTTEIVESPFSSNVPSTSRQSAGAMQLQARENTEVMAMAMMAKRFPRDPIVACDRIKNAFTRVSLAEKAQYAFARGGTDITGPSIHAAQAIAQQWGNMTNGWREITRWAGPDGVGVSEIQAFCVDYETTNREEIQFVVRHWRDTKKGGYALKEERDIYELCANQAQRRKRACILAMIPGDVVEMAMNQAAVTLKTTADTSPEAMTKMLEAFTPFGVTKEHIEKRIQRRIDSIQPAQVVMLKRIYVSLRDDMSEPRDWFEMEAAAATATPATGSTVADIKSKAKKGKDATGAGTDTKGGPAATDGAPAATNDVAGETKTASNETPKADVQGDGAPIVTVPDVEAALTNAKTLDELDDAATLISAAGNSAQQKALNTRYLQRREELGGE